MSSVPIESDECIHPIARSRREQCLVRVVGGTRVHIANAHADVGRGRLDRGLGGLPVPRYDPSQRHAESGAADWLRAVERPRILVGDFNASLANQPYQRLTNFLTDVHRATRFGLG